MKKFLIKTVLFSFPLLLMCLFTLFFFTADKGDLIRIGYLMNKGDYRSIFKEELNQPILFSKVSEISLNQQQKFKVLTIGDSFSEQFGFGYKNYLVQNNISLLHLDRFLSDNPIETAYGILNGNLLDKIKVDYIILQSVERHITKRVKKINQNRIINTDSLKIKIQNHRNKLSRNIKKESFPTQRIVKFSLHNFLYLLDDNAYFSDTYQVNTKVNLFSANKNQLLFLSSDLDAVRANNNSKNQAKLNATLNDLSKKLSSRGIQLIVLPSPDKFDFYYDEIIEKQKYPKPLFFEYFEKLPKQYCYINSKKVLRETLKNKKDIYFYDDTHWSPWSSKVLADALQKINI